MAGTVAIAQARMSSTRLPGKVLMELNGMPVVDHVLRRIAACELVDAVWVATTVDPSDDVLADHLDGMGVNYVRGSLDDVLDRYAQAAEAAEAHNVVRITCDCPLLDPAVVDRVIEAFFEQPEVDYCSNGLRRTYPIGMDAEVFSREALLAGHREASLPSEREHVTPFLYQHPERFRLRNVEAPRWAEWPELRLTLDEPSDFAMMSALLEHVAADAGLNSLIEALKRHPEIVSINAKVQHRHVDKPASW